MLPNYSGGPQGEEVWASLSRPAYPGGTCNVRVHHARAGLFRAFDAVTPIDRLARMVDKGEFAAPLAVYVGAERFELGTGGASVDAARAAYSSKLAQAASKPTPVPTPTKATGAPHAVSPEITPAVTTTSPETTQPREVEKPRDPAEETLALALAHAFGLPGFRSDRRPAPPAAKTDAERVSAAKAEATLALVHKFGLPGFRRDVATEDAARVEVGTADDPAKATRELARRFGVPGLSRTREVR